MRRKLLEHRFPFKALSSLRAVQMALWSLPDCSTGSLEPPGLSKWVSGASRAVQMALLALWSLRGLQTSIWTLQGRPSGSLAPPRSLPSLPG